MTDIKRVDIRRAAVGDGNLPYGKDAPVMVQCPNTEAHTDDSASLAIYHDHATCMACNKFWPRMEALAMLLHLPSWKDAMVVADKYFYTERTERQAKNKKSIRKPTLTDVGIYERILADGCWDRKPWLLKRGLSEKTVADFRFGHTGAAFTIPVFDKDGNVLSIRFRNDSELCGDYIEEYDEDGEVVNRKKIPKYLGWSGCNDATLYPIWKFDKDWRDHVIYVEGEYDAVALWQENQPALTVTNGAGQATLIIRLLQEYFEAVSSNPRRRRFPKTFIVCGDRDEAGIDAARKTFQAAQESNLFENVVWVQWPLSLGKDISDVRLKGYSFEEIYTQYGSREEIKTLVSIEDHATGPGAEPATEDCGELLATP